MTLQSDDVQRVSIGPNSGLHSPLAYGGSSFGPKQYTGQEDANLLGAMRTALEHGITHFDSGAGYGDGHNERLIARFIAEQPERRERMFIASKNHFDDMRAQAMIDTVDESRARLGVDTIDLFYIHWPRTGKDMRPWMEGLETARQQGKIRAIGVSNFSVEQMAHVSEAGRIDAHQLPYNLLWRYEERDLIPYCVEHNIAVVTYASLAHGILAGHIPREPSFPEGDHRREIFHFQPDVWPVVYEAVEAFKRIAERVERPLSHLAIRWLLHQPSVNTVVAGGRNAEQVSFNAAALDGEIPDTIFDELTAVSDGVLQEIPDVGNPYGYHP